MRLYAGSSSQFIEDTELNQITGKLQKSFFTHFRYNPPQSEVNAWRNSLRATAQVFQRAGLTDHGVLLEYQLPMTSRRLDCLICGRGEEEDRAVIIELKQWERCGEAAGENEVLTFVGGAEREVLHPSAQVGRYQMYLEDGHTAFHEGSNPVQLAACAYLHNYAYDPDDPLFARKFDEALRTWPVFTSDHVTELTDFLKQTLSGGDGLRVLGRIEQSEYRPSRKLMDHVAGVIKGKSEYVLLDEQLVVYDKVLQLVKAGFHNRYKHVLIIKGGPGTGKSVVAMNLVGDLLAQQYNTHYVTGSKAFTETLRKIIGPRGSAQFKYTNSYMQAESEEIDVLVVDEAHRVRKTSSNRFTPAHKKTDLTQVEELLHASRVAVFFIDDHQVVRPGEIGSAAYIRKEAEKYNARIYEYELEAQFRCSGSDAFVNWVNNTLGISRTANVLWDTSEEFDFRIVDSPEELDALITTRVHEGYTGRVTAGFCWPWSDPNDDGTLVNDVVIGDFVRPWNAKPEARRLAPGIPKSNTWAHEPGGVNQVGCVYTAQGFEFDYAGVIFGDDLTYDFDRQRWQANREESEDKTVVRRSGEDFDQFVRNTYRVLLSRGIKGCYVYFTDKDTERFFKSRIEGARGME